MYPPEVAFDTHKLDEVMALPLMARGPGESIYVAALTAGAPPSFRAQSLEFNYFGDYSAPL